MSDKRKFYRKLALVATTPEERCNPCSLPLWAWGLEAWTSFGELTCAPSSLSLGFVGKPTEPGDAHCVLTGLLGSRFGHNDT